MQRPNSPRPDGTLALHPRALDHVFSDLAIPLAQVRTDESPAAPPPEDDATGLCGIAAASSDLAAFAPRVLAFARAHVGGHGTLIVFCQGARTSESLAALRNALWPAFHVVACYETSDQGSTRFTLDERRALGKGRGLRGTALVARPVAVVFAPEATVVKFDKNAAGWNRAQGERGVRHFRWMRRYVAHFAGPRAARRVLDFGSGAGWVGIEAVLAAKPGQQPALCAFDPSPEMVRIATENAREAGITQFEGRTGFGEDPPFPAAGEEPFDLVLSSGVISFSGERERWLDGLVGTLAPGATLVIGDIHRDSVHMRERRRTRPLLPVREMNAQVREDVRARLEARGLRFEAWCGYQLSRPIPQLLHASEKFLGGALDPLLVWWNDRASRTELAGGSRRPDRFDSWVMRMRK